MHLIGGTAGMRSGILVNGLVLFSMGRCKSCVQEYFLHLTAPMACSASFSQSTGMLPLNPMIPA